jgi:RNA polymerase sigma-70 factor (TIGR02960 family)
MDGRGYLGPVATATRLDDVEALRPALLGYCYRMLGAASETEDAVQETMIRAYRNLEGYDPERASLSTWTHRIAHNVCVDLLRGARRRAQPMGLSPQPASGPPQAPLSGAHWVEPMPDARLLVAADPQTQVVQRESVRLAFIAALQHLSATQRAVLVLRDVLGFSAAETAGILDCSTAAANSSLQRARARLDDLNLAPAELYDPADKAQHDLLDRYVRAFENHDVDGLIAVLHEDATTSMPPFAWWIRGGRQIAELVASSDACAGARLLPTVINGLPGFGQYRPDPAGGHRPFALVQVETRGAQIVDTVTFLGTAARFAEFGLPEFLEPHSAAGDDFEVAGSYKQ